ncbi:hypothetical protein ACS0TY_014452 [Phlomoides rotata]
MNRQESKESDGEINPTHIEEKGECTQRENGDDDRKKGKNLHVYTRFPANSNGVAEISSMEIKDEAITVHDNEIEAVNNQNAILEDDIVEGVIAIDEYEERIANKNDIVTKEISDVLTNTILVEEKNDKAKTANIDEVVTEGGRTAEADMTLEKEDVSGCLIGLRRKIVEDMYKLYCSHARALGFSVRKGTTRYNTTIEGGDANSMIEILYEQASQETIFFFRIRHDNMVFKKSMGGKTSITMFTDQDLAMGNTIAKVYPLTRHRLCQWHLHQNAISRFGKLKHEKSFKDAFQKCLSGCDDELEFESCWKSMITEYDMEKNSWFARLYNLKAKWCTALNKDFFSTGMLSTQRSESTNSAIGVNSKKTTNLTEFYQLFMATLNKWRRNETQDEFKCSISIPKYRMQLTGMLKHASEVYTLTLFEIFEIEFMKCLFSQSTVLHVVDSVITYDISNDNGHGHRVLFDATKKLVSCTCKKFEECGLLCHHCLRVLNINNVCEIPQQYILKRWTKIAKSEIWDRFNTRIEGGSDNPASSVPWRHDMARKYYNFLLECQDDVEARNFLEDGYNRDVVAVKKLKSSSNSVDGEHSSSSNVLDHISSVKKGRRQRIKGPLQKNTKKRSINTSQSVSSNEFGTKTPNVRLF